MGPPPTWRGRFGARWYSGGEATWSAGWLECLHQLSPPIRASSHCVDAWQPRLWPNHLNPCLADQGVMLVVVGGHEMHIFTANISTFHSRYRR
jgi:hypothetical protein